MADDSQLTPLQLGQALTLLSGSVRELTTQLIEMRAELRAQRERAESDRESMRKFTTAVRNALRESASSHSQELRAARIDTPLPPPPIRHGPTRP
jgi:hypothetical protein